MNSLYNISQELTNIFNQIEELDGELTPELDDKLAITQENYANKLEGYAKAIRQFESDIVAIKEEVERLTKRKKTFEKRIERLKAVMLDAVTQFGGVETSMFKIGTRLSKATTVDTYRIDTFKRGIMDFAREIHANGIIGFGDNADPEGILEVVNANLKAEHDNKVKVGLTSDEFIPFTMDDFRTIKVNINSENSLISLFTDKDGLLETILDNEARFNLANSTDKNMVKNATAIYKDLTIGEIVENVNLSIK